MRASRTTTASSRRFHMMIRVYPLENLRPRRGLLYEERQRLLDEIGERAEELGGARPIERAMIAGQGQHQRGLDDRPTRERDDAVGDPADRQNRGLRRIDDRAE